MAKIRVLVVEDSLTVRKRLVAILKSDPEIDVIAEAVDGKAAIELCDQYRPDVVTMDMMLPVMTGLAATEYIMAHFPTPILIVSASTNRGELFRTYDALAAGALDVLEKPIGDDRDDGWGSKFLATVKLVSRIKVITHLRAKLSGAPRRPPSDPVRETPAFRAIAMGASTGGPAALRQILRALPPDFPLPILLVMHIAEPFGAAFAEWLDGTSPLPVAFAADGDPVPPVGQARVLLAPPDHHVVVRHGAVGLTRDPERHSCRPSVDILFESVADDLGPRAIGCLLTGMGRDGADGLLKMRRAGGTCLAQDEASSVVYGMPREAARLGAAQRVLSLDDIGGALVRLARGAAR
ncbi:MAG TPA: chemotaxis-specific protein-glutamate methyltransferase CheB [Polyangiaceae bacterium]|nr:chemotaxis-specific protein-glutamate methyltransferase CheB [Polyangiaceae bacterium]